MEITIDLDQRIGNAKTLDAIKYVKPSGFKKLQDGACKKYGEYDLLKLGDYIHCMNGDFLCIGLKRWDRITVGQLIWVEGFKMHVNTMIEALEKMQIPTTANEQRASENVPKLNFEQSALIFCKEYFGLHNFDIDGIRVWEFILAKQDDYSKRLFQRNYERIQQNKYKK